MKEILVDITEEMKTSYLDYAMSVIVSRALPDVRDGLKPVHRRILYAMKQLALWPNKPFKKSATIVGEVLGKFHPHGDAAVYDSLVRMAQNFSLRYPLISGHGNFGSIDGDPAAAYRYTEAKLSKIATLMLEDIDKETVDFTDNFDNTQKEPVVLPSKIPNLLLNGSSGIAVGMATNIPPHNLENVINSIIYFINNKDCEIKDLVNLIKGPDFPTGGKILGKTAIYQMYKTGKGSIPVYSKYHIEKIKKKKAIVITEIPYQVNKTKLIEEIAHLVNKKEIVGITDIRDESDRDGIRIVLTLRNDKNPQIIVNQLIKKSNFKINFNATLLVLVNGVPKILNLKQLIYYFYKHRFEVITRRTKYELDKAKARLHLIEGFLIAILNIDEVIQIIKSSKDVKQASQRLQDRFSLTQIQAEGILDMRLQKLTGLEKLKLEKEAQELKEQIKYFQQLLADDLKIDEVIIDELEEVKDNFSDKRKTQIQADEYKDIDIKDLIHKEKIVVIITNHGYIKRMPLNVYKSQHRGTKGMIGLSLKDEDFVQDIFVMNNIDDLLLFSNKGVVYRVKGYNIPQGSRTSKGTSIVNLFNIDKDEIITTLFPVDNYSEDKFLFACTKKGIVNRVKLKDLERIYTKGKKIINLQEEDILKSVQITDNSTDIIITTKKGIVNRFKEIQIPVRNTRTKGVIGIRLDKDNEVIKAQAINENYEFILFITENGYGKRVKREEFPVHNRGGKGIIGIKIDNKSGKLADSLLANNVDQIMVSTKKGKMLRLNVSEISIFSRQARGVKIIDLSEDDKVRAIARFK